MASPHESPALMGSPVFLSEGDSNFAGGSRESPTPPDATKRPPGHLGVVGFTGLLFLICSGGAYGHEPLFKAAAGPLITLVVILVLPWIWGLPVALATAEMACTLPSNAGTSLWVASTFPPWVACLSILWTCLVGFVDNAVYPALIVTYLCSLFNLSTLGVSATWTLKILLIWGAAGMNVAGIDIVARFATLMSVAPAANCALCFPKVLAIFGLPTVNLSAAFLLPDWGQVEGAKVLSISGWFLAGCDIAGHLVEEVKEPPRNMPRAMPILMSLVTLNYLVGVLPGASLFAESKGGPGNVSSADYAAAWDPGYWKQQQMSYPDCRTIGGLVWSQGGASVWQAAGPLNDCRRMRKCVWLSCLPDVQRVSCTG
eukprot:gene9293-1673_t